MSDFHEAINILKQHELRARAIYLISDCIQSTKTSEGLMEAIKILEKSSIKDVRDLDQVGKEAAEEATRDYGYGNEITWDGKDFVGDTI